MLSYLANTCTLVLQCILFFLACYYFAISIFSLFPAKSINGTDKKYKFAVVIPAHNEEASLPALLESLQKQNYPADLYSVFVMADRCADRTAEIARQSHVTLLTRTSFENTGKGAALQDAFLQILAKDKTFDAIAVLDADNIADPHFLDSINHVMQQGKPAVQGYIDSKNPHDSWLSHAYSLWYWLSNRTIQMGFDRLGLGCKLGGTGFALSRHLLETVPWHTTTMAEDAEYTIRLALCDRKIAYACDAVVYDEKPTQLSSSIRQRIRWTQGITQVQRDLCGRLVKEGKWNAFFRFWSDLLFPLCLILFSIIDFFAIISFWELTSVSFVSLWAKPLPFLLLNLYLLGTLFTSVCGLFLDRKWNKKLILNLFGSLLFMVSWIPAGLIGIVKHNKKEWYHTQHHSDA